MNSKGAAPHRSGKAWQTTDGGRRRTDAWSAACRLRPGAGAVPLVGRVPHRASERRSRSGPERTRGLEHAQTQQGARAPAAAGQCRRFRERASGAERAARRALAAAGDAQTGRPRGVAIVPRQITTPQPSSFLSFFLRRSHRERRSRVQLLCLALINCFIFLLPTTVASSSMYCLSLCYHKYKRDYKSLFVVICLSTAIRTKILLMSHSVQSRPSVRPSTALSGA